MGKPYLEYPLTLIYFIPDLDWSNILWKGQPFLPLNWTVWVLCQPYQLKLYNRQYLILKNGNEKSNLSFNKKN